MDFQWTSLFVIFCYYVLVILIVLFLPKSLDASVIVMFWWFCTNIIRFVYGVFFHFTSSWRDEPRHIPPGWWHQIEMMPSPNSEVGAGNNDRKQALQG